jgi:signal peptidase I
LSFYLEHYCNIFPKELLKPFIYLFFVVAFWIILAPQQIGGRDLYIIISGNSMEPLLKNGDLATIRPDNAYHIGDVILYHHPDLGPVIHRIIGTEGENFIVKGDHNEWVDSASPSQPEIVGKLWFHVNSAGMIIEKFRTPVGAALLAGVLGIFVLWPLWEKSTHEEISNHSIQ